MNEHQGEISFMVKQEQAEMINHQAVTLFADEMPINTQALENRLCEITEQYFKNGSLSGVADTIINRANPNFKNTDAPLPITRHRYSDDKEYLNAIISSVQAMDNTCLCIQGPPGSGKSFTAKHVISDLVKQGKRIGIMSNSHAAILHLLKSVIEELPGIDMSKVGGFKNQKDFKEVFTPEEYPDFYYRTTMSFTGKQPYQSFSVVGATAYAFVKDVAYEDPLDYLFVDEASQVALAKPIAISGAAKNIVLMGDQMQLEQPIRVPILVMQAHLHWNLCLKIMRLFQKIKAYS
ncbi:MAG: AAA family ATPase [Candidatus Methanofishera endochildressiae]|uniref:AAA family ATPase n=1 Tax=Candidatus Methanofishera endochildressiae TaxID=2738884 RepID=A0A7Z0SCY0_9GAMM|nr:AAA family ATPase [Candidatus Methanofishera endochildressiae]